MANYLEGIKRGIEQTTSRQVSNTLEKQSTIAVSPQLAIVIDKLHVALAQEFGADFAFTIMGKGHIVAASNYAQGHVTPNIK